MLLDQYFSIYDGAQHFPAIAVIVVERVMNTTISGFSIRMQHLLVSLSDWLRPAFASVTEAVVCHASTRKPTDEGLRGDLDFDPIRFEASGFDFVHFGEQPRLAVGKASLQIGLFA